MEDVKKQIIGALKKGATTDQIAIKFGISKRSAMAYMANLTRGSYKKKQK